MAGCVSMCHVPEPLFPREHPPCCVYTLQPMTHGFLLHLTGGLGTLICGGVLLSWSLVAAIRDKRYPSTPGAVLPFLAAALWGGIGLHGAPWFSILAFSDIVALGVFAWIYGQCHHLSLSRRVLAFLAPIGAFLLAAASAYALYAHAPTHTAIYVAATALSAGMWAPQAWMALRGTADPVPVVTALAYLQWQRLLAGLRGASRDVPGSRAVPSSNPLWGGAAPRGVRPHEADARARKGLDPSHARAVSARQLRVKRPKTYQFTSGQHRAAGC